MRLILLATVLAVLTACTEPAAIAPTPTTPTAATAAPTLPPPTATPELGATRTDSAGIAQVWVPAGEFQMGTSPAAIEALLAAGAPAWVSVEFASEQPEHSVRLTTGFWIDRSEVTNSAYAAFVGAGGYLAPSFWSPEGWAWLGRRDATKFPKACPGDAPEVPRRCITWYEAEAYAAWRGGALPTEAEWEFAARGPKSSVYPWGDDWNPSRANVVDSTAAIAVGSYPAGVSWVGAHDMAGNAMEWVADWLAVDYYATSPAVDPAGPATGKKKVEKGGWWGSNAFVARSAYRHYEDPPTYQDRHIGFRIVSR